MHVENSTPGKVDEEFEVTVTLAKNSSSILEEDLAISSSTLGTSDKSLIDEPAQTCSASELGERLVYVNEDAMDCCYDESNGTSAKLEKLQNVSSPEMFDSDIEENLRNFDTTSSIKSTMRTEISISVSPYKPTQEELVTRSDCNLLNRINKYLSGVPPPPSHTICQSDCNEFLINIRKNAHLFWSNPLELENNSRVVRPTSPSIELNKETSHSSTFQHRVKSSSRNLSIAFDACDGSRDSESKLDFQDNLTIDEQSIDSCCTDLMDNAFILIDKTTSLSAASSTSRLDARMSTSGSKFTTSKSSDQPVLYNTISVEEGASLQWPEAYQHKCFGIHYNRNKFTEEFENLTLKLCERYVGAETQSTCNAFFTKQLPGSARKRSLLLSKRNNGQSPGKRLNYLAKRRRTFSSANLLGLADKKQLVLNVRKPFTRKGKSPRGKGKSPRGKSPRGKSPRGKSPRNSAKKHTMRRLTLDGLTPRKSKLETSKRALFQSPPNDKAGPSKLLPPSGANPQRIKKALFPTSKKKEAESEGVKPTSFVETRKRKSEDELEGPRFKWAKSLSFDCARDLDSNITNSWNQQRHSTGSLLSRNENSQSYAKCELSDIHRRKLLWAVNQALCSKGIDMSHPQFKQYASNLARTVKKLMPDLENKNIPRKSGSTSDRMLKLAKHHLLFLLENKAAH